MYHKPVVLVTALLALGSSITVSAQQATTDSPQPAAPTSKLGDATKLRTDLVNSVISGAHTTTEALVQLRATPSPTGMQLDSDADFAFGAIDVGRRLLVLKKAVEAETFFQEADAALTQVIGRTPDSSTSDKVQYLKARASIRAEFLNRLSDARADYDAALKLSPSDLHLQQLRRLLPADPAATLQNHQSLPTKS